MKVLCFSSFTFAYLNRARVLFQSIRRFHPDWELVALITDEAPAGFTLETEFEPFDRAMHPRELNIPDFDSWIFRHDIIEACTAVKGPFMEWACARGVDAVIYLDPDTCLLGTLDPLVEILHESEVVLTPHTTIAETERGAILDNEIGPLKCGVYNLGFCAIRTTGEGARFAKWWAQRCLSFCYDDIPNGLFVDQRWCDLVPALFDKVHVLRDPGYNVASWNVSHRKITIESDGTIRANGSPLRFWHFTKLGPVADIMTKKYARDNFEVYEIWNWYKRQIRHTTEVAFAQRFWKYDTFKNGQDIEKRHRVLYRENANLQELFPDPFATGPGTYHQWLCDEGLIVTQFELEASSRAR